MLLKIVFLCVLAHLRKGDWLQITSKTVQKLKLHKHFILLENLVSLVLRHPYSYLWKHPSIIFNTEVFYCIHLSGTMCNVKKNVSLVFEDVHIMAWSDKTYQNSGGILGKSKKINFKSIFRKFDFLPALLVSSSQKATCPGYWTDPVNKFAYFLLTK